jgi:hypothetical protein
VQPGDSYAPLDLGEDDFFGEPQPEGPHKSARLRISSWGPAHPHLPATGALDDWTVDFSAALGSMGDEGEDGLC